MPGKVRPKKGKYAKGHNPLGDDLHADRFVTPSDEPKQEEADVYDGPFLVPNKMTKRILRAARDQMAEEGEEGAEVDEGMPGEEADEPMGTATLDENGNIVYDYDGEEGPEEELEYDDHESQATEMSQMGDFDQDAFELASEDGRILDMFQPSTAVQGRNLADMIMEKIREKEAAKRGQGIEQMSDDGSQIGPKVDKRVAKVYTAIGAILKSYTAGKIPKAFKVLPRVSNWEELLFLTRPQEWSPGAVYAATRIFAANLNEKMAQRYYNVILLPIICCALRHERKLHPSMYQAIKKALFKPSAFFKGFLIPMCEESTITLRGALVVASVLQRMHLPLIPTAVAIVKLTDMEYNGPNSVMLRVLIDKKAALPYQAIDALVRYFHKFIFRKDVEKLPVLWHQTLLSFCQRYKEDLQPNQVDLLLQACSKHFHHLITPEVRRELAVAQGKKSSMH